MNFSCQKLEINWRQQIEKLAPFCRCHSNSTSRRQSGRYPAKNWPTKLIANWSLRPSNPIRINVWRWRKFTNGWSKMFQLVAKMPTSPAVPVGKIASATICRFTKSFKDFRSIPKILFGSSTTKNWSESGAPSTGPRVGNVLDRSRILCNRKERIHWICRRFGIGSAQNRWVRKNFLLKTTENFEGRFGN